jgi:hypothetical protein
MSTHIKSVRILPNSCDGDSSPLRENTWEEDFPISDKNHIGIGYVVEPERFVWSPIPFAMHDHHYTGNNVPDATRANIIYEFTAAATVKDMIVIQHQNGVIEIEGFAGATPDPNGAWRSSGVAQSRLVGGATGPSIFTEFARDLFVFNSPSAGTFFKLTIRKTPLVNGWAMYRAYPRNADGDPFTAASANVAAIAR